MSDSDVTVINLPDIKDEIWFDIIDRTITPRENQNNKDISVQNDLNSRNLCFSIQRYFEDDDFYTKNIRIRHVNSSNEIGKSDVHSIVISQDDESLITFKWLIDSSITKDAGNIKFSVEFYEDNGYSWFSKPAILKTEESIFDCKPNDYNKYDEILKKINDFEKRFESNISSVTQPIVPNDKYDTQQKIINGLQQDLKDIKNRIPTTLVFENHTLQMKANGVPIGRETYFDSSGYTLPIANNNEIGGVKADAIQAIDNTEVRISSDGKLFVNTAPKHVKDITENEIDKWNDQSVITNLEIKEICK